MNAIVNTGPNRMEWLEWPTPSPGPGQVRIRVGACGVCATDIEMIAGWDRTGFPSIPGHEWAGTVDTVGPGVDTTLAGRRCVAENVLSDGYEIGFEHPGGYGQYLITEAANVQPLPGDFPLSHAALIEPLAVCVRGMNRLRADLKGPALVLGDGSTGLLMTFLLARHGVGDITVVGGRTRRLELAAEFGATRVLNYRAVSGDLGVAIRDAGGEFGLVVEATSSTAAIEAALAVVARQGRVLVIGDHGKTCASFPWINLVHKEMELIGTNASAEAWPEAVRLAAGGQAPLGRLVTHRFPARRFEEAISLVRSRREDVIKTVLEWE